MAYNSYADCRAVWVKQLAQQEKEARLRHQAVMLKQGKKKKKKRK